MEKDGTGLAGPFFCVKKKKKGPSFGPSLAERQSLRFWLVRLDGWRAALRSAGTLVCLGN